jgi:hypothetical protein
VITTSLPGAAPGEEVVITVWGPEGARSAARSGRSGRLGAHSLGFAQDHGEAGVSDTREVRFDARLRLRVPAWVSATGAQAIDSTAAVWQGEGVTVVVDEGPFADPLTRYAVAATEDTLGGRAARVVAFDREGGGHFAGAHFPGDPGATSGPDAPLTVAVETSEEVDRETGLAIVRSVEFL